MSKHHFKKTTVRACVGLGVFAAFATGCAGEGDGINCHTSGEKFELPPATTYTGGSGGNTTAPFLPVTNEVAMVQENGVLYILNVASDTKRSVRGALTTFSQPMMAGKGSLIVALYKGHDGKTEPMITSELLAPSSLLRTSALQVGHPAVDPSNKAAYALIPAQMTGETNYRIYKVFPDRRTPLKLTDGTTNVNSPSIAPSGTKYVYIRQVGGFRHELYVDNIDTTELGDEGPGTLLYAPPPGTASSAGLPFWGVENNQDMIFFQLNNNDGSTSICKIKPDGTGFTILKATAGGLNGSPVQVANGRIVFHSFDTGNMDIWSMEPDGTDLRNHTKSTMYNEEMRLFFAS